MRQTRKRGSAFLFASGLLLLGCAAEVCSEAELADLELGDPIEAQAQALHQPTARKSFNTDAKSDLLFWHASSGRVNTWLLDGVVVTDNPDITASVASSSGWLARGTGDFDRNGHTDILWWHPVSGLINVGSCRTERLGPARDRRLQPRRQDRPALVAPSLRSRARCWRAATRSGARAIT
jgi:hypothetical protein